MNLTLHIAIKDFYRLRWALLLWVVAIASELALASIQATLDIEGHVPFYMAAWTFGNIFIPVISFGLVMGLQDDDPVTEGDAFWMTRPITGARLLSAKALVLGLLCLIPVSSRCHSGSATASGWPCLGAVRRRCFGGRC